jgi:hypothetical protein
MSEMVAITQQDQLEEFTKQQQQQQHGQSYIHHPPKDKKKLTKKVGDGWAPALGHAIGTAFSPLNII